MGRDDGDAHRRRRRVAGRGRGGLDEPVLQHRRRGIGGGGHESVRAANRKLLGAIEKLFPAFVARDAPVPVLKGAVSFAIMTYGGLRVARDTEERLRQKKSPLWPVYYVGQEVISELRVATEKTSGH